MSALFTFYMFLSDTLSQAYQDKWRAAEQLQDANPVIQMFSSGGLAYVVFGVILLVWGVLFAYLFRLDRKLDRLESHMNAQENNPS